jgi:delta-1-pyrroline-5-carboxylate synthetase
VPEVVAQRMTLDEQRLDALVDGIRHIASLEDPVNRVLTRTEIAKVRRCDARCRADEPACTPCSVLTGNALQDLTLEKVTVPLGVVLAIFEARPDVVPQMIALAVRSGNGLLLKGCEDVHNSIVLMHSILCAALAPYGCSSLVALIQAREVLHPSLLPA